MHLRWETGAVSNLKALRDLNKHIVKLPEQPQSQNPSLFIYIPPTCAPGTVGQEECHAQLRRTYSDKH